MTPDVINGLFEVLGGLLIWLNVRRLYRDKSIRGVSLYPTLLFTLWGIWNLYYYPHLGQLISFLGGIMVVLANATWVIMMVYYKNNNKDWNK